MAVFRDENPGKRLRRRVFQAVKGDAEKRQTIIWRLAWGFQLLIVGRAAQNQMRCVCGAHK
jgi:hypothetical protein